jgi:hypothetical protein
MNQYRQNGPRLKRLKTMMAQLAAIHKMLPAL